MPLVFKYSDPGGSEEPAVVIDLGNTVTTVRYGTLAVTQSAELGEAGVSGISIEDPLGTLDLQGYRGFGIFETSAPSNHQRIWSGVIGDQTISRGGSDYPSLNLGVSRLWNLDLVDQSWSASVRIITGADGNRPAETAAERLRWLLQSDYFHTVKDYGHVTYPGNHLDANDYRHSNPKDVLADCALPAGYTFWVERPEAQDHAELWFMHPDSTDYTSTLSISNVLADVDSVTVFFPDPAAQLKRSPSRIAYGVDFQYANGSVYLTNSVTGNQFAFVDRSAPVSTVKTSAKATIIARRFLDENGEQDERITCEVIVPAAQVNDIRHGMRMQAKFQHLPGWESYRWARVLWRTVQQTVVDGENHYKLALELSPQGTLAPAASCSAAVAVATTDTAGAMESTSTTATVTSTIVDTGYVVALLFAYNGNTPNAENMGNPSGYTVLDNQADFSRSTWSISYKAVTAGSQTATASFTPGFGSVGAWIAAQTYFPWSSVTVVQEKMSGINVSSIAFDSPVTAGNTILMLAVTGGTGTITPGGGGTGPTTGWTELFTEIGISNNVQTGIWARCVGTGDGQVYDYGVVNLAAQSNGIYLVELATT